MRSSLAALFAVASIASALPQNLNKRQTPPPTSSAAPAPAPAPAAPAPAGPATPSNGTTEFYYPCPEGYEVTYVEEQQTYPFSFDALVNAGLGDWSTSAFWASPLDATGNTTGSTRTRGAAAEIMEVLVSVDTSRDSFYQTVTNLTNETPLTAGALMVSDYSQVLQLYANDTAEASSGSAASTVKLFSNICSNDQAGVQAFYATYFMAALDNVGTILTEGSLPMILPSASASAAASASATA